MSQFEFFMAFYSVMLGLALAELLLGFGNLLRARTQPRWGILTPLTGAVIFVQIMTSFVDAWVKLQDVTIDIRGIGIPALIGILYFIAALLCIPRDSEEWPSLDAYFHARKRLTLGALMVGNLLNIAFIELPMVVNDPPAGIIAYAVVNLVIIILFAIPLLSHRRSVAAASLAALLSIFILLYLTPLRIAGMVEAVLSA